MDPYEPATLSELISAYIDSRCTLSEAAADLLEPVLAAVHSDVEAENEKANILLYDLWHSVYDFVSNAPSPSYTTGAPNPTNHAYLSKLVDLVSTIHQGLPSGQFTWFSADARDRFNFPPNNPPISREQVTSWTNLNGFLAQVWTIQPEGQVRQAFDFAIYAIWSMRLALATPHSPEVLDAVIPGAACWIAIPASGERIFASNRQWEPGERTGAPARAGPLLEEKLGKKRSVLVEGFSKERWRFWRERFGEIGRMEEVSGATRETARAIVKTMADIESRAGT